MRRYCRYLTCFAAGGLLALAGCSTYDSVTGRAISAITPYRINIVQGNFVSKEAYEQLKPGMTRDQVRLLLGTPLLADMFHDNRWDYVFYFKRGSTSVVQERRLSLYFDGDRLARWEGGENLPSEYELVREIDGQKGKTSKPSKPAATQAVPEATAPASAAVAADAASSPAAAAPASAPSAETQNASQGLPGNAPAATDASSSIQPAPEDNGAASPASPAPAAPVPSQPITSPGGLFTLPSQ